MELANYQPSWRHTRRNPCPVCGGGDDDRRGHGVRCWGRTRTADDGRVWAICTREDYAGALTRGTSGWLHLAEGGVCKCGATHDATPTPKPQVVALRSITRSHLTATPSAFYDEYRAYGTHAPLRKLRFDLADGGKRFTWQLPDGVGGWRDSQPGERPLPDAYGAEDVERAGPLAPLFICEGENDRRKLAQLVAQSGAGCAVISPPDGAGSWHVEYNAYAAGRQVVIFADKDKPTTAHPKGEGQEHAAKVAQSIASVALTVRVVVLEDAHDIGDWIDAGGTIEQLNDIIAACMVETLTTSGALKLETREAQSCKQCARLRDELRIAEKTIARQRLHWDAHRAILSAPKEQIPASLKPAAIATYEALSNIKRRDEEGRLRVSCAAIAKRTGAAIKTTGTHLRALHSLGLIDSKPVDVQVDVPMTMPDGSTETRTEIRTELRIKEGPLFAKPKEIEECELTKRWGGARPRCKACGRTNLIVHSYTCKDCGTVQSREEALNAGATYEAQTLTTSGALKLETREAWSERDDVGDRWPDVEPEDNPSPEDITSVPTSGCDAQGDLLSLAEQLGWPRLLLDFQHIIGGNASAWRDFAASAHPEDLAMMLYRLNVKHAALSDGD